MIAGTSGEYFVGDEFVLIGAEFIIDDIQEILPSHGSDQAVLFLLEFSFKDQFDLTDSAIGFHLKTDLLFFFTTTMINLNTEFIAWYR